MVKAKKAVAHDTTDAELAFYHGWQPCTEVRGKDVIESEWLRTVISAVPKGCWYNARKAIIGLNDYADASYVEGWVVFRGGLIGDHGWIVKDAKIIDPTLPDRVVTYFAGLEFHGRAGIAKFLKHPLGRKHRDDPYHWAFGWGGEHSPSFMKAFRDVLEYQNTHFVAQTSA